ncbi:MAG: hypothetical protein J7480_07485 [Microbacteriaceae bacterium]|nr:hypothetical protein [Microbacteriaceae bacterium]
MAKANERQSPISDSRLDRVFAAMIVGIIVLSVIAMILLMIGSAGGWLTGSLYATVWAVPFVGLPIAVILMIVVTIRIALRRRRENEQASSRR